MPNPVLSQRRRDRQEDRPMTFFPLRSWRLGARHNVWGPTPNAGPARGRRASGVYRFAASSMVLQTIGRRPKKTGAESSTVSPESQGGRKAATENSQRLIFKMRPSSPPSPWMGLTTRIAGSRSVSTWPFSPLPLGHTETPPLYLPNSASPPAEPGGVPLLLKRN